ncbi:hypothetical protein RFI_37301, partial [Reticulomyxa filosa]
GREFPANVVVIGALNPFRKRQQTETEIAENNEESRNVNKYYIDDLDKEMGDLVYRVFPLPKSLQTYVWNFGSLSESDEQQYIALITTNSWSNKPDFLDKLQWFKGTEDDAKERENALKTLETLKFAFIDCIFESQKFLR